MTIIVKSIISKKKYRLTIKVNVELYDNKCIFYYKN